MNDNEPFDPRPISTTALLVVITCSAMAWCALIVGCALLVQVVA